MSKVNHKKYFAFVTLLAFLFNVSFPLIAHHNVSQAVASDQKDMSSDNELLSNDGKILICTIEGFKWVSLEDIQNGDEKPAPHSKHHCALCYVSAKKVDSDSVTDEFVILAINTNSAELRYLGEAEVIFVYDITHNHRVRAPPRHFS